MSDLARRRARRAIGGWWLLGAVACTLLPWYLSADKTLLQSLPGVFGDADTASALVQALRARQAVAVERDGRARGLRLRRRAAGRAAPGCAARRRREVGLVGLLGAGFAIGARGWAFEWLDASLGALPAGQSGLGLGGVLALASLLMLLGFGLARRGFFRGDLFIACAVVGCGALLLLFVALPVLRALSGRSSTRPERRRSPRSTSASATSASGASAAWPAAAAAAWPGTRSSSPCSRRPARPCSAR